MRRHLAGSLTPMTTSCAQIGKCRRGARRSPGYAPTARRASHQRHVFTLEGWSPGAGQASARLAQDAAWYGYVNRRSASAEYPAPRAEAPRLLLTDSRQRVDEALQIPA